MSCLPTKRKLGHAAGMQVSGMSCAILRYNLVDRRVSVQQREAMHAMPAPGSTTNLPRWSMEISNHFLKMTAAQRLPESSWRAGEAS